MLALMIKISHLRWNSISFSTSYLGQESAREGKHLPAPPEQCIWYEWPAPPDSLSSTQQAELEGKPEAGAVFLGLSATAQSIASDRQKPRHCRLLACSLLLPTAQLPGFRGTVIKATATWSLILDYSFKCPFPSFPCAAKKLGLKGSFLFVKEPQLAALKKQVL